MKQKISLIQLEGTKTKLTEFYNLVYEYKNDCLKASSNTIKIITMIGYKTRGKYIF